MENRKPNPAPPDAVILAGGTARRMGGGDKCLLPLGPQRVIDHILRRLRPQVARVAVSANDDPSRFDFYGLPVLADDVPGDGPLGGVVSAMAWADGRHVLTVPGDCPFLPVDLVEKLAQHDFALAASPSGLHPTIGLWPTALVDEARNALRQGQRRLRAFAISHGAKIVDFPDDDAFFNVNTPEDLARAETLVSQMSP